MSSILTDQRTIINHDIGRPVTGYMLNAIFDRENQKKIANLQSEINGRFGDLIWSTPPGTLHITLMDWVAPLTDYEKDKQDLFEELFPLYDAIFTQVLKDFSPITVHFREVRATPGAIIVLGQDNGEFNDIRNRFLDKIKLTPNTKQPPQIVHSTIARYQKETGLAPVVDFLAQYPLTFTHQVDQFRLVREDITPQLKYKLLKEYPLI